MKKLFKLISKAFVKNFIESDDFNVLCRNASGELNEYCVKEYIAPTHQF